jgi:hypothetical protein
MRRILPGRRCHVNPCGFFFGVHDRGAQRAERYAGLSVAGETDGV